MGFSGARLAVLAAMLVALATAGSAAAQENERGIDPNQGRSLVEVNLPDKAAAIELQLDADEVRHRLQRPLPAHERERVGHRHRLRQRGRARCARSRRLRARHDHRGSRHVAPARRGLAGRREGRGDRRGGRARRSERRGGAARRHRRPPGRLLRELRGPVPLRRGEGRHARLRPTRPGESLVARVEHRRGHGDRPGPADDERQHRPGHDAGHLHRAPHPRQGRRARKRDAAGADADPDRLEQRHVRRGRREHLARRRPAADELQLPQQLHDPVPRPDRALRTLPRARGRVPGPDDDHPAAVQDERLPAARAGADGGSDESGCHGEPQRDRRSAGRHPHVARVGPRGRQRPHGRVRQPGRRELAAHGELHRQRPQRQPGDRARPVRSRARPPRWRRRSTPAGRVREARRADLPRQRGSRDRPGAAEGQPVRLPHDARRTRTSSAGRSSTSCCGSARTGRATAPTRASTAARRRLPLLPAARPRVGDAADVPRDRGGAAPELRDRQDDAEARRRARHLHPPVVEPGRGALLDAQLQQPAQDDDQLVHGRRRSRPTTRTRPTSGRRGRTRSRAEPPSRSTTRRPAMPGAST